MKKLLIAASTFMVLLAACKKDPDVVSQTITASWPTISFGTGGIFYSINTGGALPAIAATAYDSVLKESYPVSVTGTEALDNTTPGLYIVTASAKNKFGYVSNESVYVAVTDIPASENMEGNYKRVDVSTGDVSIVTKLARGLYQLDNVAGANRTSRPDLLFPVLFVRENDSVMLIPSQYTPVSSTVPLAVKDQNGVADQAILNRNPGDTNYKYAITAPSSVFGGALRTFKKQ